MPSAPAGTRRVLSLNVIRMGGDLAGGQEGRPKGRKRPGRGEVVCAPSHPLSIRLSCSPFTPVGRRQGLAPSPLSVSHPRGPRPPRFPLCSGGTQRAGPHQPPAIPAAQIRPPPQRSHRGWGRRMGQEEGPHLGPIRGPEWGQGCWWWWGKGEPSGSWGLGGEPQYKRRGEGSRSLSYSPL